MAYGTIPTYEVTLDYGTDLEETNLPLENCENAVHYTSLDEVWNQNKMIVDDAFAYTIATNIMISDDIEPTVDDVDVVLIGQIGNKQSRSNLIHLRNVKCLSL
ncbi:hypothetical protein FF2_033570 [Malus domestica]